MGADDVDVTDIMRIILGDIPWIFLVEVVIRIFFVYLLLMVSMRLMGKRMANTMSSVEIAALVSMAAAIGVPVLAPERGLLPAVIIALIVVAVHRLIAHYSYKKQKFETLAQGDLSVLVEDGQLLLDVMKLNRITRERLFAEFRSLGLTNLGRIRRSYLEASGNFTTMIYEEEKPGLSIIPRWDEEFLEEQPKAENIYACGSCGVLTKDAKRTEFECPDCGHQDWLDAIIT
ncbi:YetF domain-containing protein [Pontibacter sp. SGAir0037]|uniref:YetF domain-containing protein n=1 Tax=Pontibacter sp. SGAir0037 TaxID=2571030 RepID=UPI0010CCF84D|nr:YetF domain-containing protein [Pontibacter sp. SGAir0037]QCR21881.1 DUF421 domain-containing protein [Pontibacter sp. SGAir0037]